MIGNHKKIYGGITSVISQLLNYDWKKDNIEISFISTFKGGSNIFKIIYFAFAYIKIACKFIFAPPDVVYMHMSHHGSVTRKYAVHKLCKKFGIKDIVHLHGSEFKQWYEEISPDKQSDVRKFLRECDALIVLGEEWNTRIKAIEPKTNTVIIKNTVPIPDDKVSWNDNIFQMIFMGVLVQRKGVADLLNAVNILKNQGKTHSFRLVVAGVGNEEESLKAQTKSLSLEDIVTFAGWTAGKDKEKLFKESQALVLPSYNEGLPVAVLEAISYGMPVVATDVGDVAQAVRENENGYLVKAGDVEALAEKIALVNDKKRYSELSENSRKIAEESFSDNLYYNTISQLLKSV
jgi:glycosyltransferase involved in cell wall biosynthesis